MTLQDFWALLRLSLSNSREAARTVMAMDLPRAVVWQVLAVVLLLAMLLTQIVERVFPMPDPIFGTLLANPFLYAGLVGALTLVTVTAMHRVGRFFGGTGDFDGALKLLTWLQIVLFTAQLVEVAGLLVFPPLAALMGPIALGLSLWLMTSFVAELHGFRSLLPVFFMILGTIMMIAFALVFLLNLLGVNLPDPATGA